MENRKETNSNLSLAWLSVSGLIFRRFGGFCFSPSVRAHSLKIHQWKCLISFSLFFFPPPPQFLDMNTSFFITDSTTLRFMYFLTVKVTNVGNRVYLCWLKGTRLYCLNTTDYISLCFSHSRCHEVFEVDIQNSNLWSFCPDSETHQQLLCCVIFLHKSESFQGFFLFLFWK